jgi:hypothetical protein
MGRRSHPGEISRGAPLPAARELFGLLSSPPEPVTLTILATIQSAIFFGTAEALLGSRLNPCLSSGPDREQPHQLLNTSSTPRAPLATKDRGRPPIRGRAT